LPNTRPLTKKILSVSIDAELFDVIEEKMKGMPLVPRSQIANSLIREGLAAIGLIKA
jgi:hypothetical protein